MFSLKPLPYEHGGLVPYLSRETLEYHHDKHHKTYVDNLNGLIPGTNFEGKTLEEIVKSAPPGPIFNNAAQVWNHDFYFDSMAPAEGLEPSGKLAERMIETWGSVEAFKKAFADAAVKTFGSGWAWLVKRPDGSLAIDTTSNASNPLTGRDTALLTCDVWEHAYYVDYRNRRAEYVEKFWHIVDWKRVEARYGK